MSPLRVIPVLDLKGGSAVHATGGDRSAYRPMTAGPCHGPDPVDFARAVRDRLGLDSLYVADLDAITHDRPDTATLDGLVPLGLDLWVDAGIRETSRAIALATAGVGSVILATETLPGLAVLTEAVRQIGADRVVFGLDLRDGQPRLADGSSWDADDPMGLIASAVAAGVRRLLLLDLARVGSGQGVGTLDLVRSVREQFPGVEIAAGGGVSSPADLEDARTAGASALLVGSALHDGRIGPSDIRGGPGH